MLTLDDILSWHRQRAQEALDSAAELERQIAELRARASLQRGMAEAHQASLQELIRRVQPDADAA